MSAKPWHKRWHGNALNGMRGLSLELRGAYQTLLDLMYDAGGPVRLDERRQSAEMDCDIRVFRRVIGALIQAEKIHLWSDGRAVYIVNAKVQEVLRGEQYEATTSAELPAEVREKFGVANAELKPKSRQKLNKNNGSDEKTEEEKGPRGRGERKNPPAPQEGAERGLFEELPEMAPVDEEQVAFDAWNVLAAACGLPVAKSLDDARRRAIRARLKDGGLDGWREALAGVERSAFCRGQRPGGDGRTFKADLGFVCQAKSYPRLREGAYGDDAKGAVAAVPVHPPFPNARIRDFVLAKVDGNEAWVRAWLDCCRWNASAMTIEAPREITAKTLRATAPELEQNGVTIVVAGHHRSAA